MPPAEAHKKGTSMKETSAKRTPTKGTPRKIKARSKVTVADLSSKSTEAITFLWAALQHELGKTGSAVDYQAVSDALGITKCAATFRYYRIRDAFANDAENANRPEQETPQDLPSKRSRAKAFKAKQNDDGDGDTTTTAAKFEDPDTVVKNVESDIKIEEEAMEISTDEDIEPDTDKRYVKMEEDVDFEA
ncbi:hypothetical protein N7523_005096 [Penicillium sp. IBT 18751x]|nr:hypothetical protein N7523_005096 [Penicillium sp. IBT 18751x]